MHRETRRTLLRQIATVGTTAIAISGIGDPSEAQGFATPGTVPVWPISQQEQAATITPKNYQFAPGDVRRYGADPSGARDSTQAFVDANSVGSHGGGSIRIPSGQYRYAPKATMYVAVSWLGDGAHETVILCDTAAFAGEFFRIVGSTELRDLLFRATGSAKVGTGVRLAPADAGQFTGHVRLTRLCVLGFHYNIRCDNNFEVTFDQVRSAMGNEGFFCAPETSEGNGYCTTHLHLNCYYGQNDRNVFYAPGIRYAFRTVTFIGGAIEDATGGSCQSSFKRCSPLKFIQIYLEAAPTITALVLID